MKGGLAGRPDAPEALSAFSRHFLLPFFQFLPARLSAQLHHRFDLGWWKRQRCCHEALAEVESIRLLSRRELEFLFPGGVIFEERLGGLVKSFVMYGGW